MKEIFRDRFNLVDIVYIPIVAVLLSVGNFSLASLVILLGVSISAFGWVKFV